VYYLVIPLSITIQSPALESCVEFNVRFRDGSYVETMQRR